MSSSNKEMIKKFRDMADLADASYAMLDFVNGFVNHSKWYQEKKIEFGDNQTLGDKLEGTDDNSTYARCIESRFMKDIVVEEGIFFDDKLGDSPKMVSATRELSQRTKNFVNRYELIEHQPNADYGFSATLFKDTKADSKDSEYILAIRGTEITLEDLSIDITLARNGIPMQCYELARFYEEQIKPKIENSKLVVVGHSLGGYLAQSFCFMYPDRVAKLYTFNSPGLLGAWNKDFIDNLLSGFETVTYAVGGAGIARKIGFKLLTKSPTTLKVMAVLGLLSLTINIKYATWIPKELQKYSGIIKYLIKNIKDSESREGKYMPYPLDKNNHYHMEATNLLDFEKHMSNTTFYVNLIQHLGTDIAGNYYLIYLGNELSNSHFLAPMLNVLYLYSYLLELDANNTMLESKLQSNNDKEKLSECLYTLNVFMKNIKTAMNILIYEIDEKNKEKYEKFKKQMKWYQSTPNYDSIDYLALFVSQVNELAFKIETLKEDNNKYFTSSIDIHTIIDTILKLQEHNYLIEIIDNNKLRAMRNQCKADNKASITEKLSLETCQPFRLVNKNNISYLNENNLHQIFGYKDLGHILSQEWHEEYINGRYKIAKGLYFGGNTISSWSKYAKDKELQIS